MTNSTEENLIINLGSQGTAALFIMTKMLGAFAVRGVLQPLDAIAILELAAEAAERTPDEFDGRYSAAVGAAVRQMIQVVKDFPSPAAKH